MKTSIYTLCALCASLLCCVTFLGNSGGAAASDNFYTGAPTVAGGTEGTCNTCHRSGNFGEPQLDIRFADQGASAFSPLTSYVPGKTYEVQVAVGHGATAPAGYGFQAQILTAGASPVTAGALSATGNAGVGVTAGTGRSYVEQRRVSNDSTFTFTWKAPDAGTGSVNIYAVGNLVNRAQGTGGDNGSSSPLIKTLEEDPATSTRSIALIEGALYPNPTAAGDPVSLQFNLRQSGKYRLAITSASGREVSVQEYDLRAGAEVLHVPTHALSPGVYVVTLRSDNNRFARRLLVK